ncbi:hypothetical protein [Rhodopirellula bahusiensis]|uniref:hypothetical protein n=1 Tax=Rhodopirellula bahusiensis TaxID=2014065 RepID=UPI003266952A
MDELEGPEITALRRHLAPVPHRVKAELTVEEKSRRVVSMMLFIPMKLSGTTGEPMPGDQEAIMMALHRFQGEVRRVVPSYIAPQDLKCIAATGSSKTTSYTIEHMPGVTVQ